MKCASCGGEVVFDDGLQAYVCASCGLVLDDRPVLPDAPWTGLEDASRPSEPRYSGCFTYRVHDHGVGGTLIPGILMYHLKEGRRWVARHWDILVKEHKRQYMVLRWLNKVAKAVCAPSTVVETAGKILVKYVESKVAGMGVLREASARRIATGALYIAMKLHGYTVSLDELSEKAGLSQRELWRAIRELHEATGVKASAIVATDHVNKVAALIGTDPEAAALASELISVAKRTGLTCGLHPLSLSAGALYLASVLLNKKVKQSDFKVAGRSDSAVRRALRRLVSILDIEVEL